VFHRVTANYILLIIKLLTIDISHRLFSHEYITIHIEKTIDVRSVLFSDLNSRLAESDAQRKVLSSKHIRIWRALESSLHLFQLKRRERHSVSQSINQSNQNF